MPRSFEQNRAETFGYAAKRSPFYRKSFHGMTSVAPLEKARALTAPLIRYISHEEIEILQMPPLARKRRTFVDLR